MTFAEIIMLAIALSVDACAVSFSYGILPLTNPIKERFMLAGFTGFFQALMPIAGYMLTSVAFRYILPFSKILVFLIFLILGIKFIFESFQKKKEKDLCINLFCIFTIAIGTSIDAFSGGISLRLSGNEIIYPALLIGCITFINALIGFQIGKNIKHMPVMYLEIAAGIILLILGIKALF